MVRALRLEYAGALYHVTARGDRREDIYEDNVDRSRFLELFAEVCERYNWYCHAYCLMSNHYHFIVETPDGNLSKGMRQLNGVYAQPYNQRHNKVVHLFQGRHTAILVEKEAYLLELSRYVVSNPVRANMVKDVGLWKWSSNRYVIGELEYPEYLNVDWVLSHFHAKRKVAIALYKNFVGAGVDKASPLSDIKHRLFLGNDAFVERGFSLIDQTLDMSEIVQIQRQRAAKRLNAMLTNIQAETKQLSVLMIAEGLP